MSQYYEIYAQGARITLDDFGPKKVIPFIFKNYDTELPDEIMKEIKNGVISDLHFNELYERLQIKPDERTLQEICCKALQPYIIDDIFVDDAKEKIGNEMVSAWQYKNITGYFHFDDENKMTEKMKGDCMMLCFDVPYVWNIRYATIPVDKRLAVFQLQQASKLFLKDDIDWEPRLGKLTAVGCRL